jgi:predicted DNA-binding protein
MHAVAMTREKPNGAYTIRLPQDLCEKLEAYAAKNRRSVAAVIRGLVESKIENGHMRLLVEVDALTWTQAGGGQTNSYRVGRFAGILRVITDRLMAAGGPVELAFELGDLAARVELQSPGVKVPGAA